MNDRQDALDKICADVVSRYRALEALHDERSMEADPQKRESISCSYATYNGEIIGLRIAICRIMAWDEDEADKEGKADEFVLNWWQKRDPEYWGLEAPVGLWKSWTATIALLDVASEDGRVLDIDDTINRYNERPVPLYVLVERVNPDTGASYQDFQLVGAVEEFWEETNALKACGKVQLDEDAEWGRALIEGRRVGVGINAKLDRPGQRGSRPGLSSIAFEDILCVVIREPLWPLAQMYLTETAQA